MISNDLKTEITSKWDVSASTYDDQHGHFIKTEEEREAWKQAFIKVLPEKEPLKVLDVGCGTGDLCFLLAEMGHNVTGIDLSQKMLERARSKARVKKFEISFETGDAENPPFNDDTFDVVFNRHLLWTLPNPDTALSNWKRVLGKDGKVFVIDGIWNDGSVNTKMRNFTSDILTLLVEKRNPWADFYSGRLQSQLPNMGGTPLKRAHGYMEKAGFKDIDHLDLGYIRQVQKKYMPFRKRLRYNYAYYLLYGKK
jgi:ubiquinone/menaquinone biosynthesis C-methylase UbiE